MVKRWMASALLATEKNFRKIMGYRDLWALDAILNGSSLLLDGKLWRSKMASTAATNFQRLECVGHWRFYLYIHYGGVPGRGSSTKLGADSETGSATCTRSRR
jgi:hypothetical protein